MAVSRNFNVAKNIRGMGTDVQRADNIVREHSHTFSSNYTLDSANNGLVAGPIFIDGGVTVTLNDSATLVIA